MEILLVRHGETDGNLTHRHQVNHMPLNQRGIEQAELVAKELIKRKPTHLLTSPLNRALETARVIGKACELIPETIPELIELQRPKHLNGNFHYSLQSLRYYFDWYFGKPGEYLRDGETYEEIRQRISKVGNIISSYPPDSLLVVVSHSVFINLFLLHICQQKKLSLWQAGLALRRILITPNTSIIPIWFNVEANDEECPWIMQQ
jgi:glucosyl-3-phosphoglycerate phosphatase